MVWVRYDAEGPNLHFPVSACTHQRRFGVEVTPDLHDLH